MFVFFKDLVAVPDAATQERLRATWLTHLSDQATVRAGVDLEAFSGLVLMARTGSAFGVSIGKYVKCLLTPEFAQELMDVFGDDLFESNQKSILMNLACNRLIHMLMNAGELYAVNASPQKQLTAADHALQVLTEHWKIVTLSEESRVSRVFDEWADDKVESNNRSVTLALSEEYVGNFQMRPEMLAFQYVMTALVDRRVKKNRSRF